MQQCPTRRAQQSAQQGGPPPQQAECKVCKLWQALHRTKSSSGQHQSVQQRGGMQPSAAGRGGPAGYRPSGGPTAQNQEAVRVAERLTLEAVRVAMLQARLPSRSNSHLPLATAVVAIEPVPPDERERRDSDRRDPRDEQERDRRRDSDTPKERERPVSLKAKKAEVVRLERKVNELVARIAEQERGGNGGDARDE